MNNRLFFIANCLILATVVYANLIEFQSNTPALASEINANFTNLDTRLKAIEENTVIKLDYFLDREGSEVIFREVNVNIINGEESTKEINGLGNLIIGYNEASETERCTKPQHTTLNNCQNDNATWQFTGDEHQKGSHNVIVGPGHAYHKFGSLVVGRDNVSGSEYTTALGLNNFALGERATVTGGASNQARGRNSSISGGNSNIAYSVNGAISGGQLNEVGLDGNQDLGLAASVSGGVNNIASGDQSSISGGSHNRATGIRSSISGGGSEIEMEGNTASGNYSSVSGGRSNIAFGHQSSVSGGNTQNAIALDSWATQNLYEETP